MRLAGLMAPPLLFLLAGCGEGEPPAAYQPEYAPSPVSAPTRKTYRFAVHPLHNPAHLFAVYGPIVEHLNTTIPKARFVLEASRNYEEFDKKLYGRQFDLALPNPYQTVNALRHGYRVFGKMGDDEQFHGIFLLRRDSAVREVADLKGKVVSFPAKTALAATMLPPPWIAFQKTHPERAAQLKLQWRTEPLPNNGLVARDDFPPELLSQVAARFFTLHESAAGRALLANLPLSRFEPANEATYQPVRDFVARFSKTVRPLPEQP